MKKSLQTVAAFIVCGIFCFSAISKILYWPDTVRSMERILLNHTLGILTTIAVIIVELLITTTIFNKSMWKYAGIFSASLVVVFTIIALVAKSMGRITECPCFGNFFGSGIGLSLVIRNLIFITWCFIWSGIFDHLYVSNHKKYA